MTGRCSRCPNRSPRCRADPRAEFRRFVESEQLDTGAGAAARCDRGRVRGRRSAPVVHRRRQRPPAVVRARRDLRPEGVPAARPVGLGPRRHRAAVPRADASCTAPARTSCRTCGRSSGVCAGSTSSSSPRRRATPDPHWVDDGRLLAAVLGSDRTEAALAAGAALRAGAGVDGVLDVVTTAVSERMLRYDPDGERDFHDDFGWLDITHGLTYANAVRWLTDSEGASRRHRAARAVDRVPRELDGSSRVAHADRSAGRDRAALGRSSPRTVGRCSTRRCSTARPPSSSTPTP